MREREREMATWKHTEGGKTREGGRENEWIYKKMAGSKSDFVVVVIRKENDWIII